MRVARKVWDFGANALGTKTSSGVKTPEEVKADYYADKYKDVGGVRKAVTGIVGSTIATVPVVVETLSAAAKETKGKSRSDAYAEALQAEKIAWNKMNDYAASYFGSFDMINEDELDRLKQEHDQAVEYRKSIEAQYEQPVDMDSWGMDLMEESAWLKNSATENLNGGWKAIADTAIDLGQGAALLPLLAGGAKAYIAGVAANAAAEEMFEKTAEGKTASDALVSGGLTAGVEVVGSKLADIEIPNAKVTAGQVYRAIKNLNVKSIKELGKKLIKNTKFEFTREGALYLIDYLADKVGRNPDAEFDLGEFIQSAVANKILGFTEKNTNRFFEAIDEAWELSD